MSPTSYLTAPPRKRKVLSHAAMSTGITRNVKRALEFTLRAGVGVVLGACSASAPPASETRINPDTVPSLALLSGGSRRGEDVSGHGAGESCEEVNQRERRRAREEGAGEEAPEEHAAEIEAVLNDGGYLSSCNVASSSSVELCVAVIHGKAEGVTVSLGPGTLEQADCIADAIRQLSFPHHDLVSVARTNFDPS